MAPKPDEKIGFQENQRDAAILNEKYKEILKSNGITDTVSEVIIKDAGLKGEGFASLTQLVTVKFDDPDKKPLNLFVKVQTENPSHTEMLDELKAFEKEAIFLTSYVSAATEMCKLKGYPDFIDFYPKCYHGDSSMIVLENLVLDKGYSLKSKEDRQDLECAQFAIKTLAKHHALGHVMIAENDGPEKFFQRFPNLDLEGFNTPYMVNLLGDMCNSGVLSNIKILEKNNGVPGAHAAAEKLKGFIGKPILIMLDALKFRNDSDNENAFVLGHGDYHNNNMMFLVDNSTKKIVHHVAIDFQVTRYNSPALDLTYYFFTSVQPQVRRSHLLDLLTLYKDTFNKVTDDLGHPVNLTLDQIFSDFRKRVGFGFWMGIMMCIGPGMALFKDMDISKMDMKDWPVIMSDLICKWIEENPEKGKETAEELVKLLQEYEHLKI